MTASLIVSIHDVAPETLGAARQWSADLAAREVPATLLVVAGPWGEGVPPRIAADFPAWLRERERAGDEIAVHGWTHRADLPGSWWRRAWGGVVARGAAEFWGIDAAEAALRAAAARDAVAAAGVDPIGFTPPGWLASRAAVTALRHLGFRYTTNHLGVLDFHSDRRHSVPVVCHRPGSAMQGAGAALMRATVPALARRHRSVRLALHPADLQYPDLRLAALEAIDRALDAGAAATTYRDFLGVAARRAAT